MVVGLRGKCNPPGKNTPFVLAKRSIWRICVVILHVSGQQKPGPKLLDQLRTVLRVKHYSYRTEKSYVHWVRRFIFFHEKRHPDSMGTDEVRSFLTHLAEDGHVSASTQNQALNALVFLYNHVLGRELGRIDAVRARRPTRLPVVLTRSEVKKVLSLLTGEQAVMGTLLYGSGLRLMECLRLRVHDIDFEQHQITVRDGKGFKDKITVLPDSAVPELRKHLGRPGQGSPRGFHEARIRRSGASGSAGA